MSNHRWCCCVGCCATTSFAVTQLPSVPYTLACATAGANAGLYTNANGTLRNLNNLLPNPIVQAADPQHPGLCTTECRYINGIGNDRQSSLFFPRCSAPTCTNWTWAVRAELEIRRADPNVGLPYAMLLTISHIWRQLSSSGPCVVPQFTVTHTLVRLSADNCPDGSYNVGTSWTDCQGVTRSYTPSITSGLGVPTATFGTPTGAAIIA